jgi:hypothetical protein
MAANPDMNNTNNTNSLTNSIEPIHSLNITRDDLKKWLDYALDQQPDLEGDFRVSETLYNEMLKDRNDYETAQKQEEARLLALKKRNESDAQQQIKRRTELETERQKNEVDQDTLINEISKKKLERGVKVEEFKKLVAVENLGNFEPTREGLRSALRKKLGAEDVEVLQNRRRGLRKQLDDCIVKQGNTTLPLEVKQANNTSLLEIELKKGWKAHLPSVALSFLPGLFTGFSFGSAINLVKYAQLLRGQINAGTILVMAFGVGLISLMGIGTEILTYKGYDDHRRFHKITTPTIIGIGFIILLLGIEIFVDGLGLRLLFAKLQEMYAINMSSSFAAPLALLIALPIVVIKYIRTSALIQAKTGDWDTKEESLQKQEESLRKQEESLKKQEKSLLKQIEVLEDDIRKAKRIEEDVEKEVRKIKFGNINKSITEIEKINREIEDKQEKIEKINGKIVEINKHIDRINLVIRDLTKEPQPDPETIRAFRQRRDKITRTEMEIKRILEQV